MVNKDGQLMKQLVALLVGAIVWVILGYFLTQILPFVLARVAGPVVAESVGTITYGLFGYLIAYMMVVLFLPVHTNLRKRMLSVGKYLCWTIGIFYLAQVLVSVALYVFVKLGLDLSQLNEALLNTIITAVCYVVALVLVVGLPWWVKSYETTKEDVGLQRLPLWRELLAAPVGFIAYVITSGIVISTLANYVPAFDVQQAQNVGFDQLTYRYEYILAFITLVIVAPVAEEILFRGYLYGKLKKYTFRWVAIILTSALFGLAHGQWNVAVDTFILSIALCLLRDMTGSLWPAIILHMIKNGLAYYLLFVNPSIINSLGG